MQNINDLKDLLLYQLQTLYAAEDLQLSALPSIIQKAHHSSLKNALNHHLTVTNEQKTRLLQIADLLIDKNSSDQISLQSSKQESKGASGLMQEAEQLFACNVSDEAMDAAIIVCVQKVEHYEIASYGTALAYAKQLQLHKVELLLKEILDEEYDADDLLSQLANAAINKESAAPAKSENGATDDEPTNEVFAEPDERDDEQEGKSERSIVSPGGRAGTSHRRYGSGESRGH